MGQPDETRDETRDDAMLDVDAAIRLMPVGALMVWVTPPETGVREAAVLMKVPVRKTAWRDTRLGIGRVELHRLIPEGPLVRFAFQLVDTPHGTITQEAFLNPADPDARAMLKSLRKQERLILTAYGDKSQRLGAREVPWLTVARQACMRIMVETEGIPVLWPAVLDRYLEEHPA